MADAPSPYDETLLEQAAAASTLRLVVFNDDISAAHPLPDSGELVIGRDPSADVVVSAPGVSRRHARLHLGAKMEIEDLSSANGTRIGDRQLHGGDRQAIKPGDAVQLGSVTVLVQRAADRRGGI